MALDIVSAYVPDLDDIDEATLQSNRKRWELITLYKLPDIATAPGSPFGDTMLTGFAWMGSVLELAIERIISDFASENPANGIIYSCPTVAGWFANMAVHRRDSVRSSGIVRIVFTTDQEYVLDRRIEFKFGSATFTMRLYSEGPMVVRIAGSVLTSNENNIALVERGDGTFSADIPVLGTAAPVAGTTGSTNMPVSQMQSITTLIDFDPGTTPENLPDLARKSRKTFYSATPTSRGGVVRFTEKEFTEIICSSAVLTEDDEMVRDTINPLGFGDGRLDIFLKSKAYPFQETQLVKIPFVLNQGASVLTKFIGKLKLAAFPYKIDSIVAQANPDVNLNPGGSDIEIFAKSSNFGKAPLAQAAYSQYEDLWIAFPMPVDVDDNYLLDTLFDESTGDQYAVFEVTYRADPFLGPVTAMYNSRDVAPISTDVLSRGLVPVVFTQFKVNYARNSGCTFDAATAKQKIYEYVNGIGYPNRYSDNRVSDIMYANGAVDVLSITLQARVQWSVAKYLLPKAANTPDNDYVASKAAAKIGYVINITNTASLVPSYQDPNIGTGNETFVSVGPRNVSYVLDITTIELSEQSTY